MAEIAGLYPDAPGFKMQLDTDGTNGFTIDSSGGLSTLSVASIQALTDESGTGVNASNLQGSGFYYGFVFPELRDIAGYFIAHDTGTTGGNGVNLQLLATSANTTNGQDGTWTTQTGPTWTGGWSATAWRTVTALTVTGVKGFRFKAYQTGGAAGGSANCFGFIPYGAIASGQNVDRLRIWHPTLNQEIGAAALDYSDAARTLTIDKTFRIKNNSATLSANSIVLSTSALTDTSPTVLSQLTISQGAAYAATQNIGNLAAGAISAVCTLRLILLSNATLSLWRQRLVATAGSWT